MCTLSVCCCHFDDVHLIFCSFHVVASIQQKNTDMSQCNNEPQERHQINRGTKYRVITLFRSGERGELKGKSLNEQAPRSSPKSATNTKLFCFVICVQFRQKADFRFKFFLLLLCSLLSWAALFFSQILHCVVLHQPIPLKSIQIVCSYIDHQFSSGQKWKFVRINRHRNERRSCSQDELPLYYVGSQCTSQFHIDKTKAILQVPRQ